MFALFLISAMTLGVAGTTVDTCQDAGYTTKQCIEYVKENSVADYSNLNK